MFQLDERYLQKIKNKYIIRHLQRTTINNFQYEYLLDLFSYKGSHFKLSTLLKIKIRF